VRGVIARRLQVVLDIRLPASTGRRVNDTVRAMYCAMAPQSWFGMGRRSQCGRTVVALRAWCSRPTSPSDVSSDRICCSICCASRISSSVRSSSAERCPADKVVRVEVARCGPADQVDSRADQTWVLHNELQHLGLGLEEVDPVAVRGTAGRRDGPRKLPHLLCRAPFGLG
jgi:hypothetical protein